MSDATSGLRLAVWGAGVMGERVARTASALPGVVVTAVIDFDQQRGEAVARAVGAEPFRTLADASTRTPLDAIYIGLPNAAHRDACLEAARQGLHVLVDKPLTTTVRDADEVLEAAAASGRFWMMGFSYRFRGEWLRARSIIRDGVIGDPYFVSDNVIEAYRSTPAWYWSADGGGGTLRLQSHHVFDRWEWVLGQDVSAVCAQMLAPAGSDVDLAVTIGARFGGSAVASSALSFGVGYEAAPRVTFTVQGSLGMIEIDETRRLTIVTETGIREERFDDDWLSAELSAFAAGIRGEALDQPALAAGRRAVQLSEASALSASQHAWVATPRDDERVGR